VVDEPVDRDHPPGVQQQHGEQRPLLRAADRDGTFAVPHLEGAEDAVPHSSLYKR
jgi:hypothetical protein